MMNYWNDSYRSPISIEKNIIELFDDMIEGKLISKASAELGIKIDKGELIKALKYDREQYQIGYNHGLQDGAELMKKSIINAFKKLPLNEILSFGDSED